MSITVHQFPCLSDNYGFLVRDDATGLAACIDTPEASVILRELNALGWKLDLILNTHWHPDHAGGNAEIKAATGATVVGPAEVERIGQAPDRIVAGGDHVMLGQTRFQVIESGGHTLGHVAYFDAAGHVAFVGDTLFALGVEVGDVAQGVAAALDHLKPGLAEHDVIAAGDDAVGGLTDALDLGRADHGGAGGGLDLGVAAGVVGMPVGVEDQVELPAEGVQLAQDRRGVRRVDAGGQTAGVITHQEAVVVREAGKLMDGDRHVSLQAFLSG